MKSQELESPDQCNATPSKITERPWPMERKPVRFIGTKIIHALPRQKDGVEGLEVIYRMGQRDEYRSWSPLNYFIEAYRELNDLTFGLALEALKMGKRVARVGWHSQAFITLVSRDCWVSVDGWNADVVAADKAPWIGHRTAANVFVPWVPNQTDMLAEDWMIVE